MRVLEVTRVAPSSNSATEFSLPITFFDIFWLTQPPVERLFFYKLNDLTPAFFSSVILPKLKHTLSLTLHHFLPLAGNLRWPSDAPKPIILYTPTDGVSLTVAESDVDFNLLSSNGVYEAVDLHPLIPELITTDDSAQTIALQITLFPKMGFCIGIVAHHAVLDGKASTLFIKSWAHICKKQGDIQTEYSALPPELTPFFDRTVIQDTSGLDMLFVNQLLNSSNKAKGSDSETKKKSLIMFPKKESPSDIVRATFEINREEIKLLRERVLSDLSGKKQIHLSSFMLSLAYVSTCMVKARGGDGDRNVLAAFIVDCRPRLNPPVPENYFGNCNAAVGHMGKAGDFMEEKGFAFAVEKLSGVVRDMVEKGVLAGVEDKFSTPLNVDEEFLRSTQLISVAGSNRFDVYGSDFGWGKPVKVVVVSIDKNQAISMAESRDGNGGIEIGLALKKHEMDKFSSFFLMGLQADQVPLS